MDIAATGSNNVGLITSVTCMPADGEILEASDFQIGCFADDLVIMIEHHPMPVPASGCGTPGFCGERKA